MSDRMIRANGHNQLPAADHEEAMARLLRLAGVRAEVPLDRTERVKRAVLDECRAVARARVVRRRSVTALAVVAAAAVAVFAVRLAPPREAPTPAGGIVATVATLEGSGGRLLGPTGALPPAPISLAGTVQVGDGVETEKAGRVGLRLPDGVSVRLDSASRITFLSPAAIELASGAVYVDSGANSPNLELRTRFGIVRDIGTQFEVRLDTSSLRVRVRSGVVEVHRGTEVVSARPGTELAVGAGNVISRAIAPYGSGWAWTAGLAPAFDIEGRPLAAFLEHVSHEEGWTLTYADPRLQREASGIILHGSTKGLPSSDALAIVLATTGLTHRFNDGELVVIRTVQR